MGKNNSNGEQNKIIKSGFSTVLQIVVASVSYVVIYLLVLNKLGKEQLGVWSLITAIPAVVAFLGSGVSGSLVRYIPIYLKNKEEENIQKIIYNGLVFNLVISLTLALLAFVFAIDILKFMFGLATIPVLYKQLFYCSIFTFLINFLSSVLLGALDGLQQIVLKNKIIICCSVVFCIAAAILIFNFDLIGLLYAQLLQAILVFITTFFVLQCKDLFKINFRKTDNDFLKLFYRYGGKLQYVSILNILFEPVSKFFLNRYFNLGVVGTYDIVNRIISLLRMLIVNSIQVIIPFVASKTETSTITLNIYAKSFRGALLLSSILFGGLITAGFSLIYGFEKINVNEFQVILIYLSIGYLINILSAPAYAIRLATGKLNYLITAQLLSTGLNILLFVLLGQFPQSFLMLLPTCLAVGISSAYIILSYQPTFDKSLKIIDKKDRHIYVASILFPLICIVISRYYFNIFALILVICFHALVMIFLVYKNDYLMNVIHILVKKEKNILNE